MSWSWSPDETGMSDEEWEAYDAEQTAQDDLELAMEDCGPIEDGWCTQGGSEYCQFICPFHEEITKRRGQEGAG